MQRTSSHCRAHAWLPGLLVLSCVLGATQPAAAQHCTEPPCETFDFVPPTISISPATGTYPPGLMGVTINWSDTTGLDHDSRAITFDGGTVTGSFIYSSNAFNGTASGTVMVGSGSRVLTAYICDANDAPNCTTATATYTGPAPSVRVTPVASPVSISGGMAASARFWVVNTGTGSGSFVVSMNCNSGGFWNCSASTTSVMLAGGDSAAVDAYFVTPASAGGTVSVTAQASGVSSTGTTAITTLVADPGFPGDDRSLQRIQRDACVVVAVGPATASECGDLRVVHALPETRVLNKGRMPVLTYNSNLGRPWPIVAEHLASPAGGTPDSVRAVLLVNGVQVASRRWKGWGPSQTRRIAISFDASNPAVYSTGVYTYTLQVTAEWLTGTQQPYPARTGRMIIVNRSASPFGAGWWLSGVEQLVTVPGDTAKLWVGGDGSARIYRGNAGGPWVADSYDRPDTLYKRMTGELGEVTVRTLPGRSEVWFDNTGQHLRTVSPLQLYTAFRWNAGYLTQINLPYASAQGDTTRYLFEYNNNPAVRIWKNRLSTRPCAWKRGQRG